MTRTQPSSTARGRSQRDRVLRAAMDIFATQGFRGASLDAVADAVGMTRQGLLHYFPSKVQLLLGVLEVRNEDDIALVEQAIADSHAFADALVALARHNQQRPELIRLFTVLAAESVDAGHPGHDRFVERYRSARAGFTERIETEQREGRIDARIAPASLAVLLIAVMDGLQLQHLLDPASVDMAAPLAELLSLLAPVSPRT
ncbi:TetR/AcrR family transcriptional regulator [Solirubrobacter ginsenosidimutans]|uniref:TetR/AcrR family transcriptional regulator n=1 Tax=Solirubrobacter ginsenosidimutans TaxID=490573 RepID=A0A9X3S562_9ACTN|nr:TetR/AcrR family transcriptional regulator [Solirubrobacter ginsenosidimutans]MDA0167340.1 TetR/AcrR family transcriptional regulator [Solirubrobacter ginsenosidimutans]